MTSTTLEQKLIDTQALIQRSKRRATLRASYTPSPDWDPTPPFRRQAVPVPPPSFIDARARFAAAAIAASLPKAA